jgi:hypothetical protein
MIRYNEGSGRLFLHAAFWERKKGEAMKSEDFLTSAELKALLSAEDEAGSGGEESRGENNYDKHTDPDMVMELKAAVSALTLRVDELEQQLGQIAAGRQQVSEIQSSLTQGDTFSPESGSISRSESYGRNRKKKKSILQKLLDSFILL